MAFGLVATDFGLKRVSCFGTRISGKCQRQVSEDLTWQPERGRRRPCRQRNRESEDGEKWGRPLGDQKKENKVTPAVAVPLFLAVLPGVPKVVSKILTALCAFCLFCTCPISYVNYKESGSQTRNYSAWNHEIGILNEIKLRFLVQWLRTTEAKDKRSKLNEEEERKTKTEPPVHRSSYYLWAITTTWEVQDISDRISLVARASAYIVCFTGNIPAAWKTVRSKNIPSLKRNVYIYLFIYVDIYTCTC